MKNHDSIKNEKAPISDGLQLAADICRILGWILMLLCAVAAVIYLFSGATPLFLALAVSGFFAWFFIAFLIPRFAEGLAFIADRTYRNEKRLELLTEQQE